ncbi:MAG TPA: hypothetical protein PK298_12050 [Chitinophagaceae bacterium]|nr:hypothetical protein [Chitinophagaceae bacterium]
MKTSIDIASFFIVLQALVGITGGIIYINIPEQATKSLNDSIIDFYLHLNGIFYGATLFFGLICGFILKRTNRLIISALLSLAVGLGFLLLHALVLPVPLFAFLSLFGFIVGFNVHLLKKLKPKTEQQ